MQWVASLLPGVKRPGRGVKHTPTSSTDVKERVELYLYSPSRPSWANFVFTFYIKLSGLAPIASIHPPTAGQDIPTTVDQVTVTRVGFYVFDERKLYRPYTEQNPDRWNMHNSIWRILSLVFQVILPILKSFTARSCSKFVSNRPRLAPSIFFPKHPAQSSWYLQSNAI